MPNHYALSPEDHKQLRISTERSPEMGDDVMCCVTFPLEFRNIQNHYPILFQMNEDRTDFECLAMFGFESGNNLFLTDGKWDARYRPIAMQIQPFLIGRSKDKSDEKKVVIDMDSPRADVEDGIRVFDDEGMPTQYLEDISNKLSMLDAGYQAKSKFIAALKKYDLLEPLTIDVELKDGSKNRLIGFHAIHEDTLKTLEGDALEQLHQSGHLMPVFMALASLSNLSELVERQNARNIGVA